jgi:anti-anti-sigma factor
MEIQIAHQDQTTLLFLKGRFDAHTMQEFDQIAMSINGPLVVDLTQVNFIDSRGLAALVSLQHRLGHLLSLRGVKDAVRLIFEITRLDNVFQFETAS